MTAVIVNCAAVLAGSIAGYFLHTRINDEFKNMAILLTTAMGIGVAFSVISILIYQGGLTLLAVVVKPWVSPLMLTELTGAGGALVLMIGLNLLRLKEIKTGNFIMTLPLIAALVLLDPWLPAWG
jgi:uncharacterized membrane protein YqgA involved in biofilm formation